MRLDWLQDSGRNPRTRGGRRSIFSCSFELSRPTVRAHAALKELTRYLPLQRLSLCFRSCAALSLSLQKRRQFVQQKGNNYSEEKFGENKKKFSVE